MQHPNFETRHPLQTEEQQETGLDPLSNLNATTATITRSREYLLLKTRSAPGSDPEPDRAKVRPRLDWGLTQTRPRLEPDRTWGRDGADLGQTYIRSNSLYLPQSSACFCNHSR